jgi:hypothetical protein
MKTNGPTLGTGFKFGKMISFNCALPAVMSNRAANLKNTYGNGEPRLQEPAMSDEALAGKAQMKG